jgi:hypothetical protein
MNFVELTRIVENKQASEKEIKSSKAPHVSASIETVPIATMKFIHKCTQAQCIKLILGKARSNNLERIKN